MAYGIYEQTYTGERAGIAALLVVQVAAESAPLSFFSFRYMGERREKERRRRRRERS